MDWEEQHQLLMRGELPQDIEAIQHDRQEASAHQTKYPIDDVSEFLPRGYRRSEKWIAEKQLQERNKADTDAKERENKELEKYQAQQAYSDLNESNCYTEYEIPNNQNQVYGNPEKWNWLFPVFCVVLFIVAFKFFGIF